MVPARSFLYLCLIGKPGGWVYACGQSSLWRDYMDYRVDEKGKIFTKHVNKRSIPVILRVEDTIVEGIVHLTLDNRLKDELNNGETFIAVTTAKMTDANSGQTLHESEVVLINKHRITWIFPFEIDSADKGIPNS